MDRNWGGVVLAGDQTVRMILRAPWWWSLLLVWLGSWMKDEVHRQQGSVDVIYQNSRRS